MSAKSASAPAMTPAIPPTDYRGGMADWVIALCERGHDGHRYAEIKVTEDE